MASNSCFSSPTCTSMTAHLGGVASPAEGLSLVVDAFVIALGLASQTSRDRIRIKK